MKTDSFNIENLDNLSQSEYVQDMLTFFESGYEARGKDDKSKFEKRIKASILTSFADIKEVESFASSLGFKLKSAFLRMENFSYLKALLVVDLEDYLKDDFMNVYSAASEIERKSKSENYDLSFSFTYHDENLSNECILSDGFIDISGIIGHE